METFNKVLDAEDTSTGGGSASAIAGAMAGSLVAMVSRLSESDKDSAEQQFYERIFTKSKQISQLLIQGSQEDAQAFQSVRSAYQLSRQTDEEKIMRQQTIQSAWLKATYVPLDNAKHCMRVCELGMELIGRANPKALSDLHCALLLAHAGFFGCLENVQINLPSLKDVNIAAQVAGQADDLRKHFASLGLSKEMITSNQ